MTSKTEQTRKEESQLRDRAKRVLESYGGYTDNVAVSILANNMGEIAWKNSIHVGRSSTPNESVIHVISLCKKAVTDFLGRNTGMYATNLSLLTRALDKMENDAMLLKPTVESEPFIFEGPDWLNAIEEIVGSAPIPDSAKYAIMAEVCKAYENN